MAKLNGGEYIFSLQEMEFPVYDSKNHHVGSCEKSSLCGVEKRKILIKDGQTKDTGIIAIIQRRFFSNDLFLNVYPKEACIALRPWCIDYDNGDTYYIIPEKDCKDGVNEWSIIGTKNSSVTSKAIQLRFPVNSLDDLSKYRKFDMRYEKSRLLW